MFKFNPRKYVKEKNEMLCNIKEEVNSLIIEGYGLSDFNHDLIGGCTIMALKQRRSNTVAVWKIGDEKVVFTATDYGHYIYDKGYDQPEWVAGEDLGLWDLPVMMGELDVRWVSRNPLEYGGNPVDYAYAVCMYRMLWPYFKAEKMFSSDGLEDGLYYVESNKVHHCASYVNALQYAAVNGDVKAENEFNKLVLAGKELSQVLRQGDIQEFAERREGLMNQVGVVKDLDDLYLVHETKYDIIRNQDGEVVLYPNGHWDTTFTRGTIHFTLNHIVTGHMYRTGEGSKRCIITKLSEVLRANPGTLQNLMAVDTWFSTTPGQPLVLPGAVVVEYNDDESKHETFYAASKRIGMSIVQGGEHGSSHEVNCAIAVTAGDLGVRSGIHSLSVWNTTEKIHATGLESFTMPTIMQTYEMSESALSWMVSHNRWQSGHVESR